MDAPSSRRFRPRVDGLESILSTSTVHAAASILPTHGLIDLRSTQIVQDFRNALIRSTPHDGRQGWSFNLLDGSPATRTIYGSATLLYRVKPLGAFSSTYSTRVKLKVDIAFATNLDDPRPRDVVVAISRAEPGFGQNVRNTIALGVIAFLKADHDPMAAALRPG
jgi:hypothetical protein